MDMDFTRGASICKAMSDEKRVKIVHILSCGELCACDLLDYFNLSQPTLSHHLAILVDSGLVVARNEGKWTHYSLRKETFTFLDRFIKGLSNNSGECLCKKAGRTCT